VKLTHRYIGRATGQHRKPAPVEGGLVAQTLVMCPQCKALKAATIHGGLVVCAERHEQPAGGAA
jgi:hypothetical protein